MEHVEKYIQLASDYLPPGWGTKWSYGVPTTWRDPAADWWLRDSLTEIFSQPIVGILSLIHLLAVVCKYKPLVQNQFWFVQILICTIGARSGETLRAIVLGVRPRWIDSNEIIPMVALVWYSMTYFPFDLLYKLVSNTFVLKLLNALDSGSFVVSVFGGIDLAIKLYPGSYVAPVLIGYISGIAGALVFDTTTKLILGFNAKSSELTVPTWSTRAAFIVTGFYLVAVDPLGKFFAVPLVTRELAILITYLFLFTRTMLTLPFGDSFNPFPFNVIEYLFYAITRIRVQAPVTTAPAASKKELNYIIKPKKE